MRMAINDEVDSPNEEQDASALDDDNNEDMLINNDDVESEKVANHPTEVLIEFSPDGRLTLLSKKNITSFQSRGLFLN